MKNSFSSTLLLRGTLLTSLVLVCAFGIAFQAGAVASLEVKVMNSTVPMPSGGSEAHCMYDPGVLGFRCMNLGYPTTGKIFTYFPATDSITQSNSTMPNPSGQACARNSATGKIYCFGGGHPNFTANIYEYNPQADLVSFKTTITAARYAANCVENSLTHIIYCMGGTNGSGSLTSEIFAYNPANNTVSVKNATMPINSASCLEDSVSHKIYCFGGHTATTVENTILIYDTVADTMSTIQGILPAAITHSGCAQNTATGKIYCLGGATNPNNAYGTGVWNWYGFVYEYTIGTQNYDFVPTAQLSPKRSYYGKDCQEDPTTHYIYCFGGQTGLTKTGATTWAGQFTTQIVRLQPSSATVTCSTNTDCGTNAFTGGLFCQGNAVYRNFQTFTCNNPGTAGSTCSSSTAAQLQTSCSGSQTCSGGTCNNINIVCSQNSDCGATGYTSNSTCQNGNVFQNFTTNTCLNPGTVSSVCTSSVVFQQKQVCAFGQTCSNGACVTQNNQCSDGVDNDNDGKIDSADPGCHFDLNPLNSSSYEPASNNEARNNVGQCSDGVDNDNDGTIDTQDSDCHTDGNPNNAVSFDGRRNETTTQQITCSTNAQCGASTFTGNQFCQGTNVYRNFQTYTCLNPGTTSSSCFASTTPTFFQSCSFGQTCSNGSCVTQNNQCADFIDNDGDGKIDSADPGCHFDLNPNNSSSYEPTSNNEARSNVGQCSDGVDNDNDGKIDSLDPDCHTDSNANNVLSFDGRRNETTTQLKTLVAIETGRNLSAGNLTWATTLYANPSDIIEFRVSIHSNVNVPINNVVVKETFPANISYANQLTVDGVADSRNITQGINIGTVSPGQDRTITFQAQIAQAQFFNFGTTTILDPVTIDSTDPNFIKPTVAPVTILVNKSGVEGASTVSTGLTNHPFLDSFFIPLLIALAGIWLWKSGLVAMPGWVGSAQMRNKTTTAQKKLEDRIAQIKQHEKI